MSENILEIFAKQAGEDFVKFGSWDDFLNLYANAGIKR